MVTAVGEEKPNGHEEAEDKRHQCCGMIENG